jgi:3-hydroxyisobutyrate dehydrogenase
MQIGIVGTGRMGTAIARRLLECGHGVQVWDRTVDNARDAREAGARPVPTLGELVNDSEVVISVLGGNLTVAQVYLGPNGILNGRVEGRHFIDMSTVSPETHWPIAPVMTFRDAGFIECPVSGPIPAALSGTLVGFAAGDALEFARVQPLLEQLCNRVEHVGPLGAGARMSLAANLLLATFWQALGEALLLVDPLPIDAARAIDLLADANIRATFLQWRAPQIVAAMNGDASGATAYDVDAMLKDLRYMAQEATARGNSLPLASRALECFDRASREGGGRVDSAAYPAYWIALEKAVSYGGPRPKTSEVELEHDMSQRAFNGNGRGEHADAVAEMRAVAHASQIECGEATAS